MSERFSYSTAQLDQSSPRTLEEDHDLLKGISLSDDIADFHKVEFSANFWAYARVSRYRETGQTHWANAIFKDEGGGIDLMYDYNYLNRAFQEDPDERDGPYRVVLGIDQKAKTLLPNGLQVGFHAFWYDEEGKLTVIKDQTIFPVDRPRVSFKRVGEDWKLLFYEDVNDWSRRLLKAADEGRSYTSNDHLATTMKVGEEKVVDELAYCLTHDGDKATFVQRTLTGAKVRTMIVPALVDIEKFKHLISAKEWPSLLKEFPLEVTLT